MKNIYSFLLAIVVACSLISCEKKYKNAPYRDYRYLESTSWRAEAFWGGWIRYYNFASDGSYETKLYYNDAGLYADVDENNDSFSLQESSTGHYVRNYSKDFVTYNLVYDDGREEKVHLFYSNTENDYYIVGCYVLEFGDEYGDNLYQTVSEDDYYYHVDRFNSSVTWEVKQIYNYPSSDKIYYDGRPYTGSTGGGGGTGNGGSTTQTEGQVTATVKAIGPGVDYSSYAQWVDGKTTTITWIYRENSKQYYIYGGTYCSDPDANGGKGVLYPCERGYNSVRVDGGYAKDSYGTTQFYDINLRFTIP